ncbi:hypothetical protein Nepgr_011640 [Nepenthes gracilis]|uniref:Uncharacterized protein n=1 Tax=Nepenthes gracilis TaxID=150966 RepID=A0AAD3SFM9_NEPGR|nr:hypothetical protein Nepgr_011640 [Nepenthes gracilis]
MDGRCYIEFLWDGPVGRHEDLLGFLLCGMKKMPGWMLFMPGCQVFGITRMDCQGWISVRNGSVGISIWNTRDEFWECQAWTRSLASYGVAARSAANSQEGFSPELSLNAGMAF